MTKADLHFRLWIMFQIWLLIPTLVMSGFRFSNNPQRNTKLIDVEPFLSIELKIYIHLERSRTTFEGWKPFL